MSVPRLDPGRSVQQIESATVVTAIPLDVDVTNGVTVPGAATFSPPDHTPCVDLRAVYGSRFKLRREADGETWGATPEAERVWLLELPCRYGVVYPHGGDILAAVVTSRIMGRRVAALPGILSSRGDTERVLKFHVDDAEAVLAILKPRPVYRQSEAQRLQLAAARAKSPLRLGGAGDRARGGEAETGSEIDAAAAGGPECQPGPEVLSARPEVVPSEGRVHSSRLAGPGEQ